jgi:hypothetical protein
VRSCSAALLELADELVELGAVVVLGHPEPSRADGAEDAVDELRRLRRSKLLGGLDRLVDGDLVGDVGRRWSISCSATRRMFRSSGAIRSSVQPSCVALDQLVER